MPYSNNDLNNKIFLPFLKCDVSSDLETGYTQTIFEDGSIVPAMPNYNFPSRSMAKELGYEDDCKRMTIDHEILHTFLCEKCGFPYSPTLWAVAHNFCEGTVDICYQYEEEAIVLSFQKYLNGAGVDPIIDKFEKQNRLKARTLKAEFSRLIHF